MVEKSTAWHASEERSASVASPGILCLVLKFTCGVQLHSVCNDSRLGHSNVHPYFTLSLILTNPVHFPYIVALEGENICDDQRFDTRSACVRELRYRITRVLEAIARKCSYNWEVSLEWKQHRCHSVTPSV